MIAHLLGGLRVALDQSAATAELAMHLDGVAAVMETQFGYDERQLLTVLEGLELHHTITTELGPL